MAAFKLKPGNGDEVVNFGLTFRADGATDVEDAEIVERLRKHFMFDEVTADPAPVVSRETIETQMGTEERASTGSEPVAPAPITDAADEHEAPAPNAFDTEPVEDTSDETPVSTTVKRRGRPPGSKNKQQTDEG